VDADSWAAIFVVIIAAVLLVIITAVETAAISLSALRARMGGLRPSRDPEALQHYIDRRNQTLGALSVARTITMVTGLACLTYVVVKENGTGWQPLIVMILVTIVVLSLLQAVPRWLVSHGGEQRVKLLTPLMTLVRTLFWAPALVLELPGKAINAMFGGKAMKPPTEAEQLIRLVEMGEGEGTMQDDERRMIRGVIALEETTAREIMRPRIDIVAAGDHQALEDAANLSMSSGHSRIPLYHETIDNIVGIIYAKDLLGLLSNGGRSKSLREIARPPFFIPDSKRLDELLREMRQKRVHLAVVIDEYGGTAGVVTIEDLLEEIVGEIKDEYDVEEEPFEVLSADEAIVGGSASVDVLDDLFDIEIEAEDFDTVGGMVTTHLGRVPEAGDVVESDGLRLRVLGMDGRRIRKLRVTRLREDAQRPGSSQDEPEPVVSVPGVADE
jgi:CBS domain containing-hemolysin-like protein